MIGCLFLILLTAFLIYDNQNIEVTYTEYRHDGIPESFDGFTICQISDLHDATFGSHQETLITKVRESDPDIIVITGDLIDSRRFDLDVAMDFVIGAKEIAPIYYVSGNHEAATNNYTTIKQSLVQEGAMVLDNESRFITVGEESIEIIGVSDPLFHSTDYLEEILKTHEESPHFQILLSHRPELFSLYVRYGVELTFSGHAHGGQIRLPFIGGIVAPGQGLFPEYDSGLYEEGNSAMYVSRGLGNSLFPLRINNRPEVVTLVLKASTPS